MSLYSGGLEVHVRAYAPICIKEGEARNVRGGWRFSDSAVCSRPNDMWMGWGVRPTTLYGWGWLTQPGLLFLLCRFVQYTHTYSLSLSFRAEPLKAYCVQLMACRRVAPPCVYGRIHPYFFSLLYSTRFFIFFSAHSTFDAGNWGYIGTSIEYKQSRFVPYRLYIQK